MGKSKEKKIKQSLEEEGKPSPSTNTAPATMGKSKEKKIKQSQEEERVADVPKEKKIKRSSQEEQERTADVKTGKASEILNVEIKTIAENPDKKASPVIGYFPSGFDLLKKSNESGESGPSIKVYKNVNSRNRKNPRMQVVVGVNGSAVNFVGTNYSGEATTPQLCNYALGVLDKETGVLKMVPVAANRIFRLDPKVGGLEQPESELPDAAKEDDTVEEMYIKRNNLTLQYSTKKNIRRDKKRDALRESGDPAMQEDMDHKLKGMIVKTEALEAIASTANARNIPPYDLEATAAETAYPLDRIILKGEWDYLLDIFERTHGGSELPSDVYPIFVCNRLHKLETFEDETKKKRMAGILSYITHLIKFKDRHSMEGVSTAKHHKLPSILQQKFSSMFGTTKEKRVPDDKQKLLISYVLVLSLFADDFRSDPCDIAKDLRMNPLSLRTHYEYLGCKFVRDDNRVLVATLPIPLDFQTVKRKRKR